MTVISKSFFNAISGPSLSCHQLLHPKTKSCGKALLQFVSNGLLGAPKFYLFIYGLETLSNWNNIDGAFVKKLLFDFLRSNLYALGICGNFHGSFCLLRSLLGRTDYYCVGLSGFCAGLAIFLEAEEKRTMNTAVFANLISEILAMYLFSKNIITRTIWKETLTFMVLSATLMYLLESKKPNTKVANLWFYYPQRLKVPYEDPKTKKVCVHKGCCFHYLYEGFSRYFLLGYALQLLKYSAPRFRHILFNPLRFVDILMMKDQLFTGLLFGGYVGIHRMVSCLLFKKFKKIRHLNSSFAGFVAGVAYAFKPYFPLNAIAFVSILQLTVHRISFLERFKKLPLKELIFAFCSGVMFHTRFFNPDLCPDYVINMLNTGSNGRL